MSTYFLIVSFLLTLCAALVAEAQIQLGKPQLEGSGCPSGAVQAVISPDGGSISILFDNFLVEGRTGPNLLSAVRKHCRFFIPATHPLGYAIEIQAIDYRGFANVTSPNRARITTMGPSVDVNRQDGRNEVSTDIKDTFDNFSIRQQLSPDPNAVCTNFRKIDFTTYLQLIGPKPLATSYLTEDSLAMIDSLDIGPQEAIRLSIRLKKCPSEDRSHGKSPFKWR